MAKQRSTVKDIKKENISNDNIKIIIYILILLFAFIPTYNYTYDKKIAFLGDNASYYVFGKAIAQGKGYVNAHVVGETKVNSFPPGYPVVISFIVNTFGEDITTVKKANGVMYFMSLVVLFFFFRQISKNISLSFILTFVMLFNFYLLQYSTWMMSEISFILFTSIALLSLSFIKTEKSPWQCGWFYVMILSLAFSYHIRSQGIALFGGIFLYYLSQRKWKYVFSSTISFIALLIPWYIRNSKLGDSPYASALRYKNYYDHSQGVMESMGDWIDRFTGNFARYITSEIPSAIFGYEPNYENGSWFYGILLLIIIGYGIYKLKKLQIALAGYILATFAILMLWPTVWTGVRFMLPLVPILIFIFFYGVYQLITTLLKKAKIDEIRLNKVLPYLFVIFLFVYYPKVDILHKEAKKPLNPLYRNYFAMAKWVKTNLEKDDIILCRKPMLFHLYSDHYVNGIIKNNDPEEVLKLMKKGKFTYIVVYGDGLSQKFFFPLYQKYPERFPIIQKLSNPDVYLMKIDTFGVD